MADIREKGEVPTVRHISEFVRRRVNVEFDTDFGDLQGESRKAKDNETGTTNGIYSADSEQKRAPLKCYVSEEEHRLVECPSMLKATIPERLELAKRARLCFSCINRGHSKKDCRGKTNTTRVNLAHTSIIPCCNLTHHLQPQSAMLQRQQRHLLWDQSLTSRV